MVRPTLSDEQRVAWLRLARTERMGAITFGNFINRFGSAQAALEALPDVMKRSKAKAPLKICTKEEAERELEDAANLGVRHIAFGEPDYPSLLRHIDDKPPFLLVKGSCDFETQPAVAIVGSRNASIAGQKMAQTLASAFKEASFSVVSGLARGIDASAHKAALQGTTVGVLAGGHQKIYPAEHVPLANDIVENGGSIVSEMPLYFEPRGQDFPRRNRIVSGLSLGVVVVEAAKRSGSLITARLAGEQGRQVFAVPGSPLDPRAEGTNKLIREGATLISSAEEVIDDLRSMIADKGDNPDSVQQPFRFETKAEEDFDQDIDPQNVSEAILKSLGHTPIQQDDIIRFLEWPTPSIIASLCELEIAGIISRYPDNSFSLRA